MEKTNDLISIEDRTIFLSGEINLQNATALACELARINMLDLRAKQKNPDYERTPIRLYICSKGGNVGDMWYMVDSIMHSATEVNTYCMGYANNEAFLVFLAGEKRFISYHASLTCDKGFYTEKPAEYGQLEIKEIKKYIYNRTMLEKDRIFLEGFGIYFSGSLHPEETAINNGVIDGVL